MRSRDNYIERSSGILMPIFSLPSPYGIGTLGLCARRFIDFLSDAGQKWWQILPVGPTSYGDSPYQSPSTFAGNPYFIDLDLLCQDGLLTQSEIDECNFGTDPCRVDYGLLYENRLPLLYKAYERGYERDKQNLLEFSKENAFWLEDYALFMAVKRHFGMRSYLEWPDDIRLRKSDAVLRYGEMLSDDVRFFTYIQYLFFSQWDKLRAYAHTRGVGIIGDMPIYTSLDSVDVWASRENFLLDENGFPTQVAGVPPDYFTKDGQLWGNPIYDYERMEKDGFSFWIQRVYGASKLYDIIRIDHFRGFASFWSVPFGEKTAKNGHWVKGPGMTLLSRIKENFPDLRFIAEDLGYPAPDVVELLENSGWPGMKVLEFAFDSRDESAYLPHSYNKNCVCYAGTHDNDTLCGWLSAVKSEDLNFAKKYAGLNTEEGYVSGLLRLGMSSVANLFIAQLQDYLELDNTARINTPGKTSGNWLWRATSGQITSELSEKIAEMTSLYGRT